MGSNPSKTKPERRTRRSFHRDAPTPGVIAPVSASPAINLATPKPSTTSLTPESKYRRSSVSIDGESHTSTEITTSPSIPAHAQTANVRSFQEPARSTAGTSILAAVGTIIATTTVAPPIQSNDTQRETPPEQAMPNSQRTTSLWEQAWKNWATKSGGGPSCGAPTSTDTKFVDELIKEVEEKKDQCEKKRWFKVTEEGEKVFLMDSLLEQLNRYAAIGDVAIQHHPDIVALAWSGFRLLLQVGTAYTGAMKIVAESLEYLVRVLSVCDIYERLYSLPLDNRDTTEHLNNSIVELYKSIIEYLFYARQYLEQNTIGRILDSFFSELGELLSSIKTGEQEVEKWANIAEKEASATGRSDLRALLSKVQQPIERIGDVVEAIFKTVERERRLEILRWLSNVQYVDHHSYFSKRRHGDTGNWLLENKGFQDWKESESSSLFWLRGDAGSGKTMLASMVIDDFSRNRDHHALAYFYCLYQDENRDNPENILRGLVKQMCLAYPGTNLPTPLLSLYEDRENTGHSSGPPRLEESEELIVELSKGVWQTTIIIDALDECNPQTRGSLFSTLKKIVSVANNIKIFVTGRNDGDIDEKLREFSNHYIHAVDNTEDINRFIDTEIERRCKPNDLKDGERSLLDGTVSADLKETIISTLKKKACGVFMWAHFQIIAICEEHIPADVGDALEKLPKDLDSTYRKVFERIDKQTEAARFTAREVLKWVLYASGDDTSPQLIIQALAVKPNMKILDRGKLAWNTRKILSICHNLVVYDETLKRLRFAHLSVQEFLERHPDFTPKESIHCYMAEILMTVLTNYHSGPEANDIPELLEHSTKYWHVYVKGSGTTSSNYLEGRLKAFLKPGLAYDAWGSRIIDVDSNLMSHRNAVDLCVPPLWTACYYGIYDICRYMLSDHRDPGVDDDLSTIKLLEARMSENTVQGVSKQDVVKLNAKNIHGRALLSVAAYRGHADILQLLLETPGVDLNDTDGFDDTPLSYAAYCGQTETVKLLLEKPEVDLNNKDGASSTALSQAASEGHTEIVKLLLEMPGVDLNSKNQTGDTPLSLAAYFEHIAIVKLLLEKDGADLNNKNYDDMTPLAIAHQRGHTEIAELLSGRIGLGLS